VFLFVFSIHFSRAQTEASTLEALVNSGAKIEKLAGSYEFTTDVSTGSVEVRCVGTGETVMMQAGHRVSTLFRSEGQIYFRYWYYSDSLNYYTYNNGKIFQMDETLFEQFTIPIYRQFKGISAGAYTVPLRLRGIFTENFDFESSLSLQANLVIGFGKEWEKRSRFDISLGVGLTGVILNSKNSLVTEERTASAFTLSGGVLWKPNDKANIGVFLGTDILGLQDVGVDWIYNKQIWMGVGVNISFNEISTEEYGHDRQGMHW
jgi:hypothetical protein